MTSEAEWHELLDQCSESLADAWLVVREIASNAVVVNWRLPVPPPDRPYDRLPVYADDLGEVSLMHWRPDVATAPSDIQRGRYFLCVVRGELHQWRWRWYRGELKVVGVRRVKAPDMVLAEPGQVFSYLAHESTVTLCIEAPAIEARRIYDPDAEETLQVAPEDGMWLPEDPALIQARQPWAAV